MCCGVLNCVVEMCDCVVVCVVIVWDGFDMGCLMTRGTLCDGVFDVWFWIECDEDVFVLMFVVVGVDGVVIEIE